MVSQGIILFIFQRVSPTFVLQIFATSLEMHFYTGVPLFIPREVAKIEPRTQ